MASGFGGVLVRVCARSAGASVRSVSGIRGTIKKAVRPGGELKLREGAVRVTFEDKLLM